MPNYRMRYSRKYFTHLDLPQTGEGDLTVTITRVDTGQLKNEAGVIDERPFLWLEGHLKPLGLNATNGATVAALYGEDDSNWPGKRITLYRTKTTYAGRTIDCIRVRGVAHAAAPATEAPRGRRGRKAA